MDEPPFLYKYASLSGRVARTRTFDILRSNRIYFCRPSDFNDPFEAKVIIRAEASREERLEHWINGFCLNGYALDKARSQAEARDAAFMSRPTENQEVELRARIESLVENESTLACFSAVNDDLLMWAHYASGHTGICLKFDMSIDDPALRTLTKVDYQIPYPELNFFTASSEEKLRRTLLTKSKHWKYEEEYRAILPGTSPGLRDLDPRTLCGVILGARVREGDRRKIVRLLSNRVQIERAEVDRFEFRIKIVSL